MNELIDALRICGQTHGYGCSRCRFQSDVECVEKIQLQAADALERLTEEVDRKDKALQAWVTTNELINALRCEKDCKDCSYWQDNAWSHCDEWGMRCDAADALEAAEKRIAELEAQLQKQDRGVCMTAIGTLYVPNYDD